MQSPAIGGAGVVEKGSAFLFYPEFLGALVFSWQGSILSF
jgi:hypothetical protein